MTTKRSSMSGLLTPKAAPEPEAPAKAGKGTADRPALTIRVNGRDDWLDIRDFCARQSKSINEVFLEAFAEYQVKRGVKPIKTRIE